MGDPAGSPAGSLERVPRGVSGGVRGRRHEGVLTFVHPRLTRSRYTRIMRLPLLIGFLLLLLGSPALAARCHDELADALAGSDPAVATGLDAVRLLERSLALVEPALPRLQVVREVPLARSEPGFESVRYLAERGLLPDSWRPDALTADTWREMLAAWLDWYGLAPLPVAAPEGDEALLRDMALALERVAQAVRPAALIAYDPAEDHRVAFWAIIWNWSVYPRLLVMRPDADLRLAGGDAGRGGVQALLPRMGNCAVQVEDFISAPEETAKRLFLSSNASEMVLVAGDPLEGGDARTAGWPLWVPQGEELAVFGFEDEAVAGLERYAAVFAGPTVSVASLLALLPRVRTNLGPPGIVRHMAVPASASRR